MPTRVIGLTAAAVLLFLGACGPALGQSQARRGAGAYVSGKVTRTGQIKGNPVAEFGITRADGVRVGDRLIVVRPSAGNAAVDEVVVEIVGARQSLGRCQHPRGIEVGDLAILQRTLNLVVPPAASEPLQGDQYCEITFWAPPRRETRSTFNARLRRFTWEGLVDIRDVEAVVFLDQVREGKMTIPAASIKQLRVNGIVLVVDGPKRTLVAAAVHDYREVVRADVAERSRIELAKARIASDERVKIAAHQSDSDARVRIAAARAAAESDERVRIVAARATAESDERVRIAEIESRERIGRDYAYAREQIVAEGGSNQGLSRALTAIGGLLQVGSYLLPEQAAALNGLAGGTAVLQAITAFL